MTSEFEYPPLQKEWERRCRKMRRALRLQHKATKMFLHNATPSNMFTVVCGGKNYHKSEVLLRRSIVLRQKASEQWNAAILREYGRHAKISWKEWEGGRICVISKDVYT